MLLIVVADESHQTSSSSSSLSDLIKSRRSVRSFIPNMRVPHQSIEDIITMGIWAPSAMNKQPTRFHVEEDQSILSRISSSIVGDPHGLFYDAPAVIFVFTENAIEGIEDVDCGLAVQNMILEAHRIGLGTTVIGWSRQAPELIVKELNTPVSWHYCIAIALGQPNETPIKTRTPPIIHWHSTTNSQSQEHEKHEL